LGIGYLPQEPSIFRGLTVEQNVMAIVELVEKNPSERREAVARLLNDLHIDHLRDSPAAALSGGERRRVEVARALATRPSFMLLDEPFAGIDPIAINDIRDLIIFLKNRGLGILITDHNVRETLGIVDRAYIIYDGDVLFSGTPNAILANPDVRKVYLGERFEH
jgi:lipopolysaccharide export system ATP-binding protein